MTSNGKDRIKAKFQELMSIIKEETVSESQEFKQDIIKSVNEIKENLEKGWDKAEGITQDKVQENLGEMMKELEAKALKVQYTIQEKYSEGLEKKDEYVVKTADSLVNAINKVKKALVNDKE